MASFRKFIHVAIQAGGPFEWSSSQAKDCLSRLLARFRIGLADHVSRRDQRLPTAVLGQWHLIGCFPTGFEALMWRMSLITVA